MSGSVYSLKMIKVKIKTNSAAAPKRETLLNAISPFNVKCSKLQLFNDFFLLWCSCDSDVDNLFSSECIEALGSLSCVPQLPPEMRAKRTILLRYVDDLIHQKDENDIANDLQQRNAWLSISDVYVFPKSPTIKITCATVAMANKACDSGVFIFNFFIPPNNISLEDYIHLTMCYKCYCYNDHNSSNCPKSSEYKICSLCSSTDHTYKQCSAQEKQCINCGGPHSTLAMSCPHRKKLIKEKRQKTSTKSYATATKSDTRQNNAELLGATNEVIAKSVMCMVVSAMKNAEAPGTFTDTMNQLLSANNLPKFSLGTITPPTMQNFVQLSQSTTTPPPTNNKEGEQLQSPPFEATIYRKKSTPTVTPTNVKALHNAGHILLECIQSTKAACIKQLTSVTIEEFNRVIEIIELGDRDFDQQAGNERPLLKRPLRSNSSNYHST